MSKVKVICELPSGLQCIVKNKYGEPTTLKLQGRINTDIRFTDPEQTSLNRNAPIQFGMTEMEDWQWESIKSNYAKTKWMQEGKVYLYKYSDYRMPDSLNEELKEKADKFVGLDPKTLGEGIYASDAKGDPIYKTPVVDDKEKQIAELKKQLSELTEVVQQQIAKPKAGRNPKANKSAKDNTPSVEEDTSSDENVSFTEEDVSSVEEDITTNMEVTANEDENTSETAE